MKQTNDAQPKISNWILKRFGTVVATVLILVFSILSFVLWKRLETDVQSDLNSTASRISSALAKIQDELRFLSKLSVFQNGIIFNSSLSVESVLNEYIDGSSTSFVFAAVVLDTDNKVIVTSVCSNDVCKRESNPTLALEWLKNNISKISSTESWNKQEITFQSFGAREEYFLLKKEIKKDNIGIGSLVFLVNVDLVFLATTPKSLTRTDMLLTGENRLSHPNTDPVPSFPGLFLTLKDPVEVYKRRFLSDLLFVGFSTLILIGVGFIGLSIFTHRILRSFWTFSERLETLAEGKPYQIEPVRLSGPFTRFAAHLDNVVLKLERAQAKSRRLESEAAVAKTTQMLAHDVRKPFSQLNFLINRIKSMGLSHENCVEISKATLEIQQATAHVDGLIQDVMSVGIHHLDKNCMDAVSPALLVQENIEKVKPFHSTENLSFQNSFNHCSSVLVNTLKIERVFFNIITNAIEALQGKGKIWFKTKNVTDEHR